MRESTIKIGYPGNCISVNHYLGRRRDGGYYIKQEAKNWIEEFQWMLKGLYIEDYQLPIHVVCSGFFKDERSAPDLSNLSKVILDAIEDMTNYNDKDFRFYDGVRMIGYAQPYLVITIAESIPAALELKNRVGDRES